MNASENFSDSTSASVEEGSRVTDSFTFVLPFDFLDAVICTSMVIFLSVFGIIANIITVVTIQKSQNLKKSTWNQLIVSLTVSDLMSAIVSPVYLYSLTFGFDNWRLPRAFCKIVYLVDPLTSYATTSHILLFSVLRFISLHWPHQFKIIAARYARKIMLAIWTLSTVAAIPFSVITDVYESDRSQPLISSFWAVCATSLEWGSFPVRYVSIAYPIFFYIPFVLILCFSLGIGIKIFVLRKKRNAKKGDDGL